MKRRGCIDCSLLESHPGQWRNGRCPWCTEKAERQADTASDAPKAPPVPDDIRRPLAHLAAVAKRYPDAWKQVDAFRADRGKGLPDWPQWCYMPLAGAFAIATGGRENVLPQHVDVAVIGALAAWRVTQGVYRLDPTLLAELWDTPVTGNIPVEILERLPEWCCYVALDTPRRVWGMDIRGFFVHLEADANDGRRELRFLADFGELQLSPIMLHVVGNLSDSIRAAMDEVRRQADAHGSATGASPETIEDAIRFMQEHGAEIAPLVSIVLYLCSTAAEIVGRDGQNKPLNRPQPKHTRRGGPRTFAAPRPEMWQVGFRIGATLRAAALAARGADRGGTHTGPRPHIRRAHWHAFWTGPKATPVTGGTERKLVLRWLHPILVAASEGEIVPAVHPVKK